MPSWFVRGLRRGVVTTRYPARPDESAAWLPTPPAFRPDQLTREDADRMIAVCPGPALRRRDDTLIFDVGACTACGRCAEAAPRVASSSGEFELATTVRSALIKEIPIRGGER
jgi:formate hydrogenlyase subunit 6/NADH:ubiquinone oxidoreductase subunit I